MPDIKTFVFLDLEATGITSFQWRPRVMEVAMYAVTMEEFQTALQQDSTCLPPTLPRVINKLVLCVYPQTAVHLEASEITGLDNYNLENLGTFDSNFSHILTGFVCRLPHPVCLVAHNGLQYDFPLIKAELCRTKQKFSPFVFCADTLKAFPEIFPPLPESIFLEDTDTDTFLSRITEDDFCKNATPNGKHKLDHVPCSNPAKFRKPAVSLPSTDSCRSYNTTPLTRSSAARTPAGPSGENVRRRLFAGQNCMSTAANTTIQWTDPITVMSTPSLGVVSTVLGATPKKLPPKPAAVTPNYGSNNSSGMIDAAVRRRLFTSPDVKTKKSFVSYALGEVYRRTFNQEFKAHTAESDTVAMLELCLHAGHKFVDWINKNCVSFETVAPMWTQNKKKHFSKEENWNWMP